MNQTSSQMKTPNQHADKRSHPTLIPLIPSNDNKEHSHH